jgi:hypothetical protein
MKKVGGLACLAMLLAASFSFAADKKDERAGKCADAKSQMDYFCNPQPGDTMQVLGTACTNAKKNVGAACEGKVEADQTYEFKDTKKK